MVRQGMPLNSFEIERITQERFSSKELVTPEQSREVIFVAAPGLGDRILTLVLDALRSARRALQAREVHR